MKEKFNFLILKKFSKNKKLKFANFVENFY